MNSQKIVFLFAFVLGSFLISSVLYAQKKADPRGAFLRSLALPGWGHYYTNNDNWGRGAFHLGAEAILIASYAGLRIRSSKLEQNISTLALLRAGVDIDDRNRSFQLAIADFNSLREYNDFQLRSRNWNRLLDESSENEWRWDSEQDRQHYNELRTDRETIKNQLPAIAALMVVNRVLSAVSAYSRAKTKVTIPEVSVAPYNPGSETGIVATVRFRY